MPSHFARRRFGDSLQRDHERIVTFSRRQGSREWNCGDWSVSTTPDPDAD